MNQSGRIAIILFFSSTIASAQLAAQDAPTRPDPRRTIPEKIEPPRSSRQPAPFSAQDINNAKEALRAKGLNPGPSDGVWDSRTQQALREFQQAYQLPVTGTLDTRTAEKLGIVLGRQKGSTNGGSSMGDRPDAAPIPKSNSGL
jgi:peptidoglycan hydrolase-like protein with peptidoglycan-binding domain